MPLMTIMTDKSWNHSGVSHSIHVTYHAAAKCGEWLSINARSLNVGKRIANIWVEVCFPPLPRSIFARVPAAEEKTGGRTDPDSRHGRPRRFWRARKGRSVFFEALKRRHMKLDPAALKGRRRESVTRTSPAARPARSLACSQLLACSGELSHRARLRSKGQSPCGVVTRLWPNAARIRSPSIMLRAHMAAAAARAFWLFPSL